MLCYHLFMSKQWNLQRHPNWKRHDVVRLLNKKNAIGIELGVAAGGFSKRMVDSGYFLRFYGIDSYEDNHNTVEYKQALLHVGLDKSYHLLRMRFSDAIDLFPDEYFDFIYIDGYAHTGQLGGETIVDWYPKLKPGGVLCGDDYDEERWPLVTQSVQSIVAQLGGTLHVTDTEKGAEYSFYPSWALVKPDNINFILAEKHLVVQGYAQDVRVKLKKKVVSILRRNYFFNK